MCYLNDLSTDIHPEARNELKISENLDFLGKK